MTKGVNFTLCGRDFCLRLDCNALAWLEEKTGIVTTNLSKENLGVNYLLHALYAAMEDHEDRPTIREIGKALTEEGKLTEAMLKIGKAIQLALTPTTKNEQREES